LQTYRARQEGKVLEARFGDEYRQYKSRTWF
jgi:protein-S-isoprenylcysteine O-methyltransferase Ste14